jgi:hypothetical protein
MPKKFIKALLQKITGAPRQPAPPMPPVPAPRWDWLPPPSGGAQNRATQAKAVGMEVLNLTAAGASAREGDAILEGVARLMEQFGLDQDNAEELLAALSLLLENAPLTININGKKWFEDPNESKSYTQMFEVSKLTIEGRVRDVAKPTQSGLPSTRDDFERYKLLKLSPDSLPQHGKFFGGSALRFGDTGGLKPKQGGLVYVPNNTNFVGASRPRYAAVNYSNSPNGAVGALYGRSCFVLHDWLKDKATFCAGDSFAGWVDPTKFCNKKTMGALIAWAPDPILEHLVDVYLGQARPSIRDYVANDPGKYFIEAHLYQEVEFKTCVKALHLSVSEAGKYLRNRKHALEFCNDNGIKIELVP